MSVIFWSLLFVNLPAHALEFVFPTKNQPTHSYLESPRKFGANRAGGRLHAACDLYRPSAGEEILAVTSGQVIRDLYYFYQGTYALEVKHPEFVVRYGEITSRKPAGVGTGAPLFAGQVLGYIGKVNSGCCFPMLHFELYSGNATGPLTQASGPYQRRSDLLNPTSRLQQWEFAQFGTASRPQITLNEEPKMPISSRLTPAAVSINGILPSLLAQLANLVADKNSLTRLQALLHAHRFTPRLTFDRNPDTGEMVVLQIVGGNSGVRNLRAQYFTDENHQHFLQHLSFEIDLPHKDLNKGIAIVQTVLPKLGQPQMQTPGFRQWTLPKGYVLWIKQQQMADLIDHPFFSYSGVDANSIRVALELDPHLAE